MSELGAYHTALSYGHEHSEVSSIERVEFTDGVALRHDIWRDLPADFDACDVIYAEPPWPIGYQVFNERANVTAPPWSAFQVRLADHAAERLAAGVGTILLGGKLALRYHPNATKVQPVTLNHDRVNLICYGVETEGATTIDVMNDVASRFACIGDYCCGYGRTITIVRRHAKRFVMSDHNGQCIGYIAKEFG